MTEDDALSVSPPPKSPAATRRQGRSVANSGRQSSILAACLLLAALCAVAAGQYVEKTIWLPDSLSGVVIPTCGVFNTRDNKLYVGGEYESCVVVIDAATRTRVARIKVPGSIRRFCYNPGDNKVYCAATSSGTTVIDGSADTVLVSLPYRAHALCYVPSRNKVYCAGVDTLRAVDGQTNAVVARIPIGPEPRLLCYATNLDKLYCIHQDGDVEVIDCTSDSIESRLSVFGEPVAVCYDSVGRKLYCTTWIPTDAVVVIDAVRDSVVASIPVPAHLVAASYSSTLRRVFVASQFGYALTSIDCATDTILARLSLTAVPSATSCSRDGTRVFVAAGYDIVYTVAGSGNRVLGNTRVGATPLALATGADGSLAVICRNDDAVCFLDGTTGALLAEVAVGARPSRLVYNRTRNKLYCATATGLVYVVNPDDDRVLGSFRAFHHFEGDYWLGELRYNEAGDKLYCAAFALGEVAVADCAIDSVVASIPVGTTPFYIAVNPERNMVYCTDWIGGTAVSVIDGATNEVVSRISLPEPSTIAYCAAIDDIFCAVWNRRVAQVDCASETTVASLMGQAAAVVVSPTGGKAYLGATDSIMVYGLSPPRRLAGYVADADCGLWNANRNRVHFVGHLGQLVTIDGDTDSLMSVLRVGPAGLENSVAIACDSTSDRLFVVSYQACSVYVVSGTGDTLIGRLPTGTRPLDVIWCPSSDAVYAANSRASCITVISDTATGMQEPTARAQKPRVAEPTLVRRTAILRPGAPGQLLDVTGRKVADLEPGPYDLRRLSPGVYFVRTPFRAPARKIVVVR